MSINVTPGTGKTVATETIAGVEYGQVKILGGETGSTSVLGVNPDRSINVSVLGKVSINPASVSGTVNIGNNASVSGTVGASIIGVVPVTFSAQANQSVSGAINIASAIGAFTLYAQPTAFVSGAPSIITGTASVQVLAAPSAALRNHVTHILVSNNAAVSTAVNIVDAGTVIYTGYAGASGGGFSATLPTPLRQPTSGLGLYVATPTQASVLVSMSGFTA